MDYSEVCSRVRANGEPGFAWLENMRNYGRMNGVLDRRDSRAQGGNPCLEQTLVCALRSIMPFCLCLTCNLYDEWQESYELCCLVETFPNNHSSLEDYLTTLKYAYLYAKTGTCFLPHSCDDLPTNSVLVSCLLRACAFVCSDFGPDALAGNEPCHASQPPHRLQCERCGAVHHSARH
jgi:hypothetical protein